MISLFNQPGSGDAELVSAGLDGLSMLCAGSSLVGGDLPALIAKFLLDCGSLLSEVTLCGGLALFEGSLLVSDSRCGILSGNPQVCVLLAEILLEPLDLCSITSFDGSPHVWQQYFRSFLHSNLALKLSSPTLQRRPFLWAYSLHLTFTCTDITSREKASLCEAKLVLCGKQKYFRV